MRTVLRCFIIAVALAFVSCSGNRHVNTDIGYELTGPAGWQKRSGLTFDDNSVTFLKVRNGRETLIKVQVDHTPGGSSLTVASYYMASLVSRLSSEQRQSLQVLHKPQVVERAGREWATFTLQLLYPTLSISQYFVTVTEQHAFFIYLATDPDNQLEDERLFHKTIDSFKLR